MRTLHPLRGGILLALAAAACGDITNATRGPSSIRASLAAAPQGCVSLEFEQDGILPSSQGFAYVALPAGAPESTYFSVGGGMLHLNTLGTGVSVSYVLPGGFDPGLDFTLKFRMRVHPATDPFGVDFEVSDAAAGKDYEFGFFGSGLLLPPPPAVRAALPYDVSGEFHTYRVEAAGGTSVYTLSIDGVPAASGAVSGGDPSPGSFLFGDLTLGGDGAAEIDFIRYCQVSPLQIDVKPGTFPNSVNPGAAGVIPVAVHTTPSFDAAALDPATARFGVTGTEAAAAHASHKDVDGDGDLDLLLHFRTRDTGIACGTDTVSLTVQTSGGATLRGADSVRTVGCG
jgi:hypothetical protein